MINKEEYIAHVRQAEGGKWLEHSLQDHLHGVARLAEIMANDFGSGDWASIAGLWHDLGKYKSDFQSYIRSVSGYNADAHLENTPGKVDHSTAGAIYAIERHPHIGKVLAYLIAGHHAGLPDWNKGEAEGGSLATRLLELRHLIDTKLASIPSDILNATLPKSRPPFDPEHAHLWIRMLFSSLVDADFLDTELFMDPQKSQIRGNVISFSQLKELFQSYVAERDEELKLNGQFGSPLNQIRRSVLEDCRRKGLLDSGLFSLTVPTGGGKTLSSVAFALEHAIRFNKNRIIIAIPYTSIIEQTAQVLTKIFGSENVIEHHSNFDFDRETTQGRLASENWDAPIIVTTNVQLFESLFSARTSRCRKLHNIANSVIILDEAQMLPPELLAPTLSVIKGLSSVFNCSIVLCTATQPALNGKIGSEKAKFNGLEKITEIISDPDDLAKKLQRVAVRFHEQNPVSFENLSEELARYNQVLCIVNRRQDCRDIWNHLKELTTEEPIHLSALMCGEHRSRVISKIKADLINGTTLRVVSTQLVEAGVDIDFPVVYRAMTGLDSIAQAAGRCNREGRKNNGELGEVVVFNPPKPSPPGLLRKREDAAAEVIRTSEIEAKALSSLAFKKYFITFYSKVNDFGNESFKSYFLTNASNCEFQFRSAAKWYKLIDEQGYRSIVVWYEFSDGLNNFSSRDLISEIKKIGPKRKIMRKLQRCTVNIPENIFANLKSQSAIQELTGPEGPIGLWAQSLPGLYDNTFGLRLDGPLFNGTEFIC